MIDHTNCDHPRTSSARAKCRRAQRGDDAPRRQRAPRATPKEIDEERVRTPRDKDKECDNCGVERISLRGTDPLTGVLRYVGNRCSYILKQATDVKPLD